MRNVVATFVAQPHFSEAGQAGEGQDEDDGAEDKKEEEGRRKGSWHSHISIRTRQHELSLGGRPQP